MGGGACIRRGKRQREGWRGGGGKEREKAFDLDDQLTA